MSEPMSQNSEHRGPVISHLAVVRLAVPMTLAHLSTPLLGFVDAAVIGRLGEAYLLGAIAAAAVVFDFTFWGFGFLRMGTAGLTAQSLGRGDKIEGHAVLLRALIIAFVLGCVLIALQRPIAWIGFSMLDASGPVTRAARSYFDIRIWSAPAALANYALLGAFIGRGKTATALGLQILINLSNGVLNVIFVYGFALGVRGSALGTLIAEIIGLSGGLVILTVIDRDWFTVQPKTLKDRARLFQMMAINRDLIIRTLALTFSYAFFTAQGARGGDVILAANAILMNLYLISAYFLDGFATAAQQLCGQAFGAADGPRFRAAVRLTMLWCLTFAAGLSICAFIGGHAFIVFVTTNEAVRAAAWTYMPFAASAAFVGALAFELDGVFYGAIWTRDMRNVMLISLALYLLCFAALKPFGNTGLWLAFLLFLTLRGVIQYWYYRGLVREAFPLAQSAAPVPTASATTL
jgi:MATE family multidrug resistance protein